MDLGPAAQSWSTTFEISGATTLYPLTPSRPPNHEISHQLLESTHTGLKYTKKRNREISNWLWSSRVTLLWRRIRDMGVS